MKLQFLAFDSKHDFCINLLFNSLFIEICWFKHKSFYIYYFHIIVWNCLGSMLLHQTYAGLAKKIPLIFHRLYWYVNVSLYLILLLFLQTVWGEYSAPRIFRRQPYYWNGPCHSRRMSTFLKLLWTISTMHQL